MSRALFGLAGGMLAVVFYLLGLALGLTPPWATLSAVAGTALVALLAVVRLRWGTVR